MEISSLSFSFSVENAPQSTDCCSTICVNHVDCVSYPFWHDLNMKLHGPWNLKAQGPSSGDRTSKKGNDNVDEMFKGLRTQKDEVTRAGGRWKRGRSIKGNKSMFCRCYTRKHFVLIVASEAEENILCERRHRLCRRRKIIIFHDNFSISTTTSASNFSFFLLLHLKQLFNDFACFFSLFFSLLAWSVQMRVLALLIPSSVWCEKFMLSVTCSVSLWILNTSERTMNAWTEHFARVVKLVMVSSGGKKHTS